MGFAQFMAGVGRTVILNSGSGESELKSTRYCMLMPWNIVYAWLVIHLKNSEIFSVKIS